jgi:DNA polymerase III subunit epsilon
VPEYLKTRTALKKMGLKPKRGAQPVAVKTHYHWKTPDYALYDMREAVPHVVSDKQKAALEKARAASLQKRTCKQCGWVEDLSRDYRGKIRLEGGYCPECAHQIMVEADRAEAVKWARRFLDGLADGTIAAGEVLILDSETTSLYGEIIELAMIDLAGNEVYNQRFKPVSSITPDAERVHGSSADMLTECPSFASEYPKIRALLEAAGKVLIYNAEFDYRCLQKTMDVHDLAYFDFNAECLMKWYAQFVGHWSHYWGNYRWQSLNGTHGALGDCRAALGVLKEMAAG